MVRIGQLFLSGGRWDGEQLVPEDWVEQATSEQVDADMMDAYGFQWWVDRTDGEHSFQAIGYGGQQIVVVPGRALVVVLATQVLQADPSSRGIDNQVLTALVADTIVSRFPAP